MIDNFNNFDAKVLFSPSTTPKTATATSAAIAVAAYDAATAVLEVGTSGDTLAAGLYWTGKLTEGETSGGSFTDVADAECVDGSASPSNAFALINSMAEDNTLYRLGYLGNAPYLKVVYTPTGSIVYGIPISGVMILGRKRVGPADADANP